VFWFEYKVYVEVPTLKGSGEFNITEIVIWYGGIGERKSRTRSSADISRAARQFARADILASVMSIIWHMSTASLFLIFHSASRLEQWKLVA
jgi:hypothetical protein